MTILDTNMDLFKNKTSRFSLASAFHSLLENILFIWEFFFKDQVISQCHYDKCPPPGKSERVSEPPRWRDETVLVELPMLKCLLEFLVNFSGHLGNRTFYQTLLTFSSVQFSRSVVSNSLRPHESQKARPPCPSPTPGVHSDSRDRKSVV